MHNKNNLHTEVWQCIPFMVIYINSYTMISKYCLKSNVLFSKTKVAQKTNKCDKAQVPYGKNI